MKNVRPFIFGVVIASFVSISIGLGPNHAVSLKSSTYSLQSLVDIADIKIETFEGNSAKELRQKVEIFIAGSRAYKRKLVSIRLQVAYEAFEIIGSRGSRPVYMGYIFYVNA